MFKKKLKKTEPNWFDLFVYNLFMKRWNPIFNENLRLFDEYFVNLCLWRQQRGVEQSVSEATPVERKRLYPGQDSEGNWIN